MQLKNYQENTLRRLDLWFGTIKKARLEMKKAEELLSGEEFFSMDGLKNFPESAWKMLKKKGELPTVANSEVPDHITRTSDSGEPIPHVCLKIPTGGGKTLLGVAALERVKSDTGFVLWVVPTKAIYEQTNLAFRTREHPYRMLLEHISGGKLKLLTKTDRFTKQDIENYLCIMMLMLPSANQLPPMNTEGEKDFLRIFRDSGNYGSFFPEPDDMVANQNLLEQHPDLTTNKEKDWVRQSLFNALKLIRPTVILDEAHKAYGNNAENQKEFVKSISRLNPRLVLELSATPLVGISNILVAVSGTDLQKEEMIKLPIEIHDFKNSDWKHTLAEAKKKRDQLEDESIKLNQEENRFIRPIALVRVQRTGKQQRGEGKIHADDAKEYLVQNLGVPAEHIRIQSSIQKELAGEDLLSKSSIVRWIITKDALKEGWDCSFAYVLALLDNTTAPTAMTQMVGRVMRQPHASRVDGVEALNQCYIYCYNWNVGAIINKIKMDLEKEGLTGLGNAVLGYSKEVIRTPITVKRRTQYSKQKIFLPRVLHVEGKGWRPLDYDRDILGAIDWSDIDSGNAVDLTDKYAIREIIKTMDLQGQGKESNENLFTEGALTLSYFVQRLMDVVPNPWQAARIAEQFLDKHRQLKYDNLVLLNCRSYLLDVLRKEIEKEVDFKAETVFRKKVKLNKIRFHLEIDEQLDYAFSQSFELYASSQEQNFEEPIKCSLFTPVFSNEFNSLENDFALYLEESDAIYWWHKIAARQANPYFLQGWRRHRVYPDFIACCNGDNRLLIIETKGRHLEGNEDTEYKIKLLDMLEKIYLSAIDRGKIVLRHPEANFRMMFEDTWKEDVKKLTSNSA